MKSRTPTLKPPPVTVVPAGHVAVDAATLAAPELAGAKGASGPWTDEVLATPAAPRGPGGTRLSGDALRAAYRALEVALGE